MALQLDDLERLEEPGAEAAGIPLLLPIDTIEEDPSQPRREFDRDSLQELAATIAERGVRQPISVRRNPDIAGRWVLNFGARRLRASKLAGKVDIPAFIDETADSYDQVIENEQREALKPLEVALFVQRRIAAGDNQADIARRLGKSRQYVTFATALIDAPDWLMDVYRERRCKGMTELYELRKLHAEQPEQVEAWASDREPITRDRISALRTALNTPADLVPASPAAPTTSSHASRLRQRLEVDLDGAAFELLVNQAPDRAGEVFIRSVDGTDRRAVFASRLKLLGFVTR